MPPPLLLLQDIIVTFGVTPLLAGAELAVAAGDRVCLVGRNGSGKSTLLRIAAGLVQPDAGDRFAQPGSTIHYLPQEPDLSGFASTLAYVEAGFGAEMTDSRNRALYLLKEIGLSGEELPSALSGGEARPAALARVLAPSPDILLLDEPTNHLALPGIEWLERELAGMRSGIVLISHDPPAARAHLAHHDLARPRHHPDPQRGLQGVRALARRDAGAGGGRAAQARPQDRDGGGLAALWRHRTAHPQPEAARRAARAGQGGQGGTYGAGFGPAGGGSGRVVGPAGRGRAGHLQILWRSPGRAGFFGAHSARRPGRARRPQRCRQDDIAQSSDRRADA